MTKKKKVIIGIVAATVVLAGGYAALASVGNSQSAIPTAPVINASRTTLETSVTAQGEVYLLPGQVVSTSNTV